MNVEIIQNKIYEIRDEKVMLDYDLAALYEVETKVFNQAVKRNLDLFPSDFMFQLTTDEAQSLRSQIVTLKTTGRGQHSKYLPYAFTEHGVAMLASVLKSPKARKMNITIVRAFISLKKMVNGGHTTLTLLKELKERIDEHDTQLSSIYDAIESMLDEQANKKAKELEWNDRERIGFKKQKM